MTPTEKQTKEIMSFTEKLDAESLKYFNEIAHKPFQQQAIAFLNAYWPEVNTQAEFIFTYVLFFSPFVWPLVLAV